MTIGLTNELGLNSLCDYRISRLPNLTAWLPICLEKGRARDTVF